VVAELGGSALFGARFRENAARALLIPRRRPGQRTPLWQQRLKAQGLLQVARRYGSFPVVLETYRECLQDVFDLPALKRLLRGLLDADAVEEVERQLRRTPRNPDELHDQLRLRGDLRGGEYDAALARPLLDERRVVRVRVAGEERLIAAEDAGRYRDALGAMP